MKLADTLRHPDAAKHLSHRLQRLRRGHVKHPVQAHLDEHRRVADALSQGVGAGANVHEIGRFEIADGFGNELNFHAGPWDASRPVRQSSI